MYHKSNHLFPFFHLCILLLCGLFLLPSGVWAEGPAKEIRIADGKGDWGYPNPISALSQGTRIPADGHGIRHPGLERMRKVTIPALAKSWRYDPDSVSYIFELQEGVSCGMMERPFTADDVVFTIDYFKKASLPMGAPR